MAGDKKYFWLKLKKDFFKRHDIAIVEAMPNGKDYILFYLKLLCESLDHDGQLRFSETIPYDENMLAALTRTNIDVVRSAMKVFTSLNMIEVLDDLTIYMCEVEKMIGTETFWAEKKRIQRAKEDNVPSLSHNVQNVPVRDKSIEYRDKNIEYRDNKGVIGGNVANAPPSKRFIKPTIEEIKNYCEERENEIDPERFFDFYESKGWLIGKNQMKDWKAAVRNWEGRTPKKEKLVYANGEDF